MKNLYKLSKAAIPYKGISVRVKDDMTKQEREVDKKLQEEAKKSNERDPDSDFFFRVRGLPWERKVVKVRKRVEERVVGSTD